MTSLGGLVFFKGGKSTGVSDHNVRSFSRAPSGETGATRTEGLLAGNNGGHTTCCPITAAGLAHRGWAHNHVRCGVYVKHAAHEPYVGLVLIRKWVDTIHAASAARHQRLPIRAITRGCR